LAAKRRGNADNIPSRALLSNGISGRKRVRERDHRRRRRRTAAATPTRDSATTARRECHRKRSGERAGERHGDACGPPHRATPLRRNAAYRSYADIRRPAINARRLNALSATLIRAGDRTPARHDHRARHGTWSGPRVVRRRASGPPSETPFSMAAAVFLCELSRTYSDS